MKNKFLCIGGILLSTISFTFSQSNNINQKNNNAKLFNEKIIRVNEEKEDMMQFNNENDRIIICNERELMSNVNKKLSDSEKGKGKEKGKNKILQNQKAYKSKDN